MMKNYKTILYILFAACILTGLFFIFYPILSSIKEPVVYPAIGTISGSVETIQISFPVPMDRESVETRLKITPATDVDLKWNDSVLEINPTKTFLAGSLVEIKLKQGASSMDGREYSHDFIWSYTIRQPDIIFLGNATTSPEVWSHELSSGQNTMLTNTGGHVTDLAASQSGNVILFVQKNSSGGSDIFAIRRPILKPEILVSCEKEICTDPAISSDGRLFAFSRNRDPEEGTTSQLSYIYTGEIDSGEAGITPLITEKTISGILPSFSPDGQKLSFYDIKSQGIRIVNKSGTNDFLLGTNRMQRGSWSPDGMRFIFVDDEMGEHAIFSRLYSVDITNSSISEPLKDVLTGKEMGEPDWSPDGNAIVVGVRAEGGPLTRQLVLYDLNTSKSTQITNDSSVINASPCWSPDGQYVVFQQARLGTSNTKPVISLWDAEKKDITMIAEDAALPVWLP